MEERDWSALRTLADELGERFVGGVVVYRGDEVVTLGRNLAAVPVQELWKGA